MSKHNNRSLRETIQFYLIDCQTLPGKIIDISILFINLLVCAFFVIETYNISAASRELLWTLEVIMVFFFIVEYLARLYGARNRLKHVFNIYSIIDLIAIIPTISLMLLPATSLNLGFVKVLRVLRVFRVFRFLRFTANPDFFFGKITWHLLRVVRLLITLLMIFFISSGLFWSVESAINSGVQNFGDAFYFTVVALTTVGFGDIIPLSVAGKWVTVLMILSGIVFIPWQASQIVREWGRMSDKNQITCSNCGLKFHDKDASHCKSCGHVIYQEYAGS
ncbi:MAG: ion transporter [Nanoarchaeota archaeon]|nr:ion transporter [Nanoarchaeota archaeon]MBU1030692.1 ion transporter [Nanoarchaeota archaeon]MBU1849351.1 ion transporter [Nanoarchaeota archaeon]